MKKRRRKLKFDKQIQKKLLGVFAFVLLVLVILNLKIAYINIKSGDKYAKQVLSQKEYDSRTIPYRRGEIQDRNGNVLARSEKVYTVILDCKAVNEKEAYLEPTVQALASSFGLDAVKLRSLITAEDTKNSQYQVLKKKVTQEEKDAYEASISTSDENLTKEEINQRNNVKGIWFEESYVREYPMKSLASTVVGFSNDLSDGIVGLESYYTDVLNGVNGREFGYLNEDSELQRTVIEPENGYSLVSTLDVNIQQIVEKYIKQLDEELSDGPNQELNGHGAKNIAVIGYKEHAFPTYQPEMESVTTVSGAIECAVSVGNYMKATGYEMSDPGRLARCAAVTGETAAKAVELLNIHFGFEEAPAEEPKEEVALGDNEYIGTGVSDIGGDVKVKVTMDGDKIAKIDVLSHNETSGISDPAFEQIPAAIIEAQSADVDVVAGATKTSEALIAAVKDALSQVK